MVYVIGIFTVLHFVASVTNFYHDRVKTSEHHEICTMLGMIALAILWRM